ncbi:MAG: site-specific DNA-methyltransferase, partial [Elusimicrobiota bacterium]|nr:site-specific DNA-methyltransferase [Elusimicrobiota bacterium]
MFDEKALVNWKRFAKNGVSTSLNDLKVKRDENGTIKDNLIIKGNNLLALHSLKKQFAGKVKLIYIDPPYNTGNDGFKYNDNFNHSTWLTFMKNRLEVARELLRDDGVIFCSINHLELAYITILMDDIFGKKNKLPIVTLKVGTTASYRSINDCPVNVSEYVIAYSIKENFKPNVLFRKTGYSKDYSHLILNIKDTPDKWKLVKLTDYVHEKNGCDNWREYKKKNGDNWKKKRFEAIEEIALKNRDSVVSLNTLQKPSKKIQEAINKSKKQREKVFEVRRDNKKSIYCYNGRTLAFFGSKFRDIEGDNVPAEVLTNLWTDISFLGIGPEGGVTLENGKKPEYLLKTIIELSTKKNDIVLDYHLGSGTTCAVAHKMERQYIGIEQMDYVETIAVERMKKVIDGEQGGISKSVNWQGGGDFIYFELAKWNEKAKEKIQKAKSLKELEKFFDEMYEKYFLNYNLKIKEFTEKVVKEDNFKKLSLDEQKKMFIAMLDNNQMYVQKTEMADKKFGIGEEEQRLT